MSDPYESYMREFVRDLRQIAVWKPGSATELGEYGELQDRQWIRLGSIWDLFPDELAADLKRRPSVSAPKSIRFGSATASKADAGAEASGAPGKLKMRIGFRETHSVYFRASNCVTRSLMNTDAIIKSLWGLSPGKWRKSYRLVSEVSIAESFVVLVGGQAGSQLIVSAESSELLSNFDIGTLKGKAGIDIKGDTAVQIVGGKGPYSMTLLGIRAPWWKKDQPSAQVTHGMEGGIVDELFPDPWEPEQFLKEISA